VLKAFLPASLVQVLHAAGACHACVSLWLPASTFCTSTARSSTVPGYGQAR